MGGAKLWKIPKAQVGYHIKGNLNQILNFVLFSKISEFLYSKVGANSDKIAISQ